MLRNAFKQQLENFGVGKSKKCEYIYVRQAQFSCSHVLQMSGHQHVLQGAGLHPAVVPVSSVCADGRGTPAGCDGELPGLR